MTLVKGGPIDAYTTFLSLTDTPDSYAGQAGKNLRVKVTEDGLEFTTSAAEISIGDIVNSGTPGSVLFVDTEGKLGQDSNYLAYNPTVHALAMWNSDLTNTESLTSPLYLGVGTDGNSVTWTMDGEDASAGGIYFAPIIRRSENASLVTGAMCANLMNVGNTDGDAVELGYVGAMIDVSSITATNAAITSGRVFGFLDTFNSLNVGTGSLTVTLYESFVSAASFLGIKADITDFIGFHAENQTSSGTITDLYGVKVDALSGATNNYGVVIGDCGTNALWVNDTNDSTDEAGGIVFGSSKDTSLYRGAANQLKTLDDVYAERGIMIGGTTANPFAFRYAPLVGVLDVGMFFDEVNTGYAFINTSTTVTGVMISAAADGIFFGSALDTFLYRSAANTLQTNDTFIATTELQTGGTDKLKFTHDESNAYVKWDDGVLFLTTDEGTNTNSIVGVSGKGTGYGEFRAYSDDDSEWIQVAQLGSKSWVQASGASDELQLNPSAAADISCFDNANEGEVHHFSIDWRRTGDASQRAIFFKGSVATDDTFLIYGCSDICISPNITIGTSTVGTGSLHVKHDGVKTNLFLGENSAGADQFIFGADGSTIFNQQGNAVSHRFESASSAYGLYCNTSGNWFFDDFRAIGSAMSITPGTGVTVGYENTEGTTPYFRIYGFPTSGANSYMAGSIGYHATDGNYFVWGDAGSVDYARTVAKYKIGPGAGVNNQKGDLQVCSANSSDGELVISNDRGDSSNFNWFFTAVHNGGTNYFTLTNEGTGKEFLRIDRTTNYLSILDADRVGIGTISPDTLFHLTEANATCVIRTERNQASISSSDIIARWEVETQDTTDPGICATIAALSYGSSCETGWRFQAGTPSALIEVMQIDPNGFVGLGTPWPDSPDTLLHLQHATDPYLRFTRDDTAVTSGEIIGKIEFETKDSTSSGVAAYIKAAAEGTGGEVGLYLATGTGAGATDALTINKDGDVDVVNDFTAGTIQADNGWSGSFTNGDGNTVTVVGGVITGVA